MIKSFKCRETEKIWLGERSRRLPDGIQNRALVKLRMVNRAKVIQDMRNPPGNRLKPLGGDRLGQMSIRINREWRICFEWREGDGAYNVEINNHYDD